SEPRSTRHRINDSVSPPRALDDAARHSRAIEVLAEQLLGPRDARPIVIRRAPTAGTRNGAAHVEQRNQTAVTNARGARAFRAREIHVIVDSNVVHGSASVPATGSYFSRAARPLRDARPGTRAAWRGTMFLASYLQADEMPAPEAKGRLITAPCARRSR